MGAMASPITGFTIVYSTAYSGADQRKHQSSVSLAFVRRIHRWSVNSPHNWPVTRKMFPFYDVIMLCSFSVVLSAYAACCSRERAPPTTVFSPALVATKKPAEVRPPLRSTKLKAVSEGKDYHHSGVKWALWRLKSPASWLFQHLL